MYVEHNLQKALSPYIIEAALPLVERLLCSRRLRLDLSSRKSRILGFYANKGDDESSEQSSWKNWQTISLQIDLNPYALLLVFVHEWAHLVTHFAYPEAKPHGREWKKVYAQEIQVFLKSNIFPKELKYKLEEYFKKPAATWDTRLQNACEAYGKTREDFVKIYLKHMKKGEILPSPREIRIKYAAQASISSSLKEKAEAKSENKPVCVCESLKNINLFESAERLKAIPAGQLDLPADVLIEKGENKKFARMEIREGSYIVGKIIDTNIRFRVHVLTYVIPLRKAK